MRKLSKLKSCILFGCVMTMTSCIAISTGRDFFMVYPRIAKYDTFIRGDDTIVVYNCARSIRNRPWCVPDDTINLYTTHELELIGPSMSKFTLESISVTDKKGNDIPFFPYLRVPKTPDDEWHIPIDSIPCDMTLGLTNRVAMDTIKERSRRVWRTVFGVEVCIPYVEIESLDIRFVIRVHDDTLQFNSSYRWKFFFDTRPSLF